MGRFDLVSDHSCVLSPEGFFLPTIDVVVQHNAAVSRGDYLMLLGSALATTGVVLTMSNVAAARKFMVGCVALDNYAANTRGRYRIQGLVMASVKSTGGTAIVRDMALRPGTSLDFDTDAPTINEGRWLAKVIGEAAAGATSSTVSASLLIELVGPPGLGNYGSGT